MAFLVLLAIMVLLFVGTGLIAFTLSIIGKLWLATEFLFIGVIGGLQLFGKLCLFLLRTAHVIARFAWRASCVIGLWFAQHVHAASVAWGTRLARDYIAYNVRMRRQRRAH